jgi:uracil permease
MMVEDKTDFSQKRNLIIASVILVIGIGGAKIHIGSTEIGEMSLATYVGVLLNLILPKHTPGDGLAAEAATQPDA